MPHHYGGSSSKSKSSGRGRTDAGANRTTAYKAGVGNITESGKKTASYKSSNPDAFRNRGATKIKKGIKTPFISVNVAGAILSKPLQAGSKITRDFYTDKVLGSKNYKNKSKLAFLSQSEEEQEKEYKSYIRGRQEGTIDAYGNSISKSGNGDNRPPVKKVVGGQTILAAAPTEAEVSQSDAANAAETKLTKRRVKARGRKMNIYAQSKDKLTLGKKTLLGVV